jgi:hypothetical protein
MDGDFDAAQVTRMKIRRIRANQDRLAHHGGAFADDETAAAAVVRAADLAPFTAALKLRVAGLEQNVVAPRIDLLVIADRTLAPFESRLALRRAHEFYL